MYKIQDKMTEIEIDMYFDSLKLWDWSEVEIDRALQSGVPSPESRSEKNRLLHNWLLMTKAGLLHLYTTKQSK